MNTILTSQLIEIIGRNNKKFVQARLVLDGCYATHFLFFNGRYLYDEGIDGETRKTNFLDFGKRYLDNSWIIDQIVL